MSRHSLRPMSTAMMAKAERGANRLNSLLERHLDPEQLCEALGAVRTRALMRLSRKFYKSTRELLERFATRYGDDTRRALAHVLSIAVQKEDFSISYDSWLRSLGMLADALHAKGMDAAGFLRFSFSDVVKECGTCEELDAAARVAIQYSDRLGNPNGFCKDALSRIVALHMPASEFVNFCDVLMERLQTAGPDAARNELVRAVARELEISGAMAPENARKLIGFLRAGPSPPSSP
ncbi:MAG: hypothetical protein PHQ80_01085 [Candidatus ainarchaeum sp.]|nr:hypothetical protein [Candidatus ainarchaeum sp.]MDD5095975.1 hypothetical protein [Candidatus ainarchaeum sp.]